jgi:drug/metabolite transporter (DMT)-like permease
MIALSQNQIGFLFVLLAALGFASKTIMAKLAYSYGVDALTLITLRMLTAFLFFFSILLFNIIKKHWSFHFNHRIWISIFILGFFGYYISSFLDLSGLMYIDANLGRMILFLYPTMVVIINSFIKREKISNRVRLALSVCYLGLFFMVLPNLGDKQNNFFLGCFLVFSSALIYSFYLVFVERLFKSLSMPFFISLIMIISTVSVVFHYSIFGRNDLFSQTVHVYILAISMGIVSTVIPIYALSLGIAMIGAPKAAMISMFGPIMTLVMGTFILNESVTIIQLIGIFLILTGVWRIR